jgi:acyl carrier protein
MTQAADIEEKVKAIINDKLRKEEKEITPQTSFKNDLGTDSLDMVELVMEFEKEFNIVIPDDDAVNITTVGEAIEYIRKNIEQRTMSNAKS